MHKELKDKYIDKLKNEDLSCIISDERETLEYLSKDRGVKPMMDFYREYGKLENLFLFDKVIGKAAALLSVLIGVKYAYGDIVSKESIKVYQKYNVEVKYSKLVERIVNRTGDGYCPMESLVMDTESPHEAHKRILEFIKSKSK